MQELEAKETQLKMSLGQLAMSLLTLCITATSTDSSGAEKKLAEIEMAKNKKVFPYYFITVWLMHLSVDPKAS